MRISLLTTTRMFQKLNDTNCRKRASLSMWIKSYVCPADSCWNFRVYKYKHIHIDHWSTSDIMCSHVLHILQLFWFLIPICFSYYVHSPLFGLNVVYCPPCILLFVHCVSFHSPNFQLVPIVHYIFHTVTYGAFLKWGTPKSSMFMGISLIHHPFCGTPIYGNPHMDHMSSDHSSKFVPNISMFFFALFLQMLCRSWSLFTICFHIPCVGCSCSVSPVQKSTFILNLSFV